MRFDSGRGVRIIAVGSNADLHAWLQVGRLADLAVAGDLHVGRQGAGVLFLAQLARHDQLVAGDADDFAVLTIARELWILVEPFDPSRHAFVGAMVVTRILVPALRSAALQAFPSRVSLTSRAKVWECSWPSLLVITSLSLVMLTTLPSWVLGSASLAASAVAPANIAKANVATENMRNDIRLPNFLTDMLRPDGERKRARSYSSFSNR